MRQRTHLHRIRDLMRLACDLGLNAQPIRFAWHLLYRRGASRRIRFRLRSLGGRPVDVRTNTSDLIVLFETFGASYDAPPAELSGGEVGRIWDLGSNIGLTVARYAAAFPAARISGVELDADNAQLARDNIASFAERCEIIAGAVWPEDGTVSYKRTPMMEHGAHVVDSAPEAGREFQARAWALNTLFASDEYVDFVKMDIEGAESVVLTRNTDWARKVKVIKVECHTPYRPEDAVNDLTELGFETARSDAHWATVVGINRRPDDSIVKAQVLSVPAS